MAKLFLNSTNEQVEVSAGAVQQLVGTGLFRYEDPDLEMPNFDPNSPSQSPVTTFLQPLKAGDTNLGGAVADESVKPAADMSTREQLEQAKALDPAKGGTVDEGSQAAASTQGPEKDTSPTSAGTQGVSSSSQGSTTDASPGSPAKGKSS